MLQKKEKLSSYFCFKFENTSLKCCKENTLISHNNYLSICKVCINKFNANTIKNQELNIIKDSANKHFYLCNTILKVVPSPILLSTEMLPPRLSTIFLQVASPSPVPSYFPLGLSLVKASKMASCLFSGIPIPLSETKNSYECPIDLS